MDLSWIYIVWSPVVIAAIAFLAGLAVDLVSEKGISPVVTLASPFAAGFIGVIGAFASGVLGGYATEVTYHFREPSNLMDAMESQAHIMAVQSTLLLIFSLTAIVIWCVAALVQAYLGKPRTTTH